MRKRDDNKIQAIRESVLDLCMTEGLSNLTTAKVAQRAGVSPATIYIYYHGKTDLLSRLYVNIKTELHAGLATALGTGALADRIQRALAYSVTQYQAHPKKAKFLGTLWNAQEMLDDQALAFGQQVDDPLAQLFHEIQADPAYVDAPVEVIAGFFEILVGMVQRDPQLSPAVVATTITMIVKALKK